MSDIVEVAKAIELLDQIAPANWRDEVNIDTLDMDSGEECVLGQIYGDYNVGIAALREKAEEEGVSIDPDAFDAFDSGAYEDAWREALS